MAKAKSSSIDPADWLNAPAAAAFMIVTTAEHLAYAGAGQGYPQPNEQGLWSRAELLAYKGPGNTLGQGEPLGAVVDQTQAKEVPDDPHITERLVSIRVGDKYLADREILVNTTSLDWTEAQKMALKRLQAGMKGMEFTVYGPHAPEVRTVRNTQDVLRCLVLLLADVPIEEFRAKFGVRNVPEANPVPA